MSLKLCLLFSSIVIFLNNNAEGQKLGISISVGTSIPIASYASKNANRSAAIVTYNGNELVAGYYIKKAGFALPGEFYEASAEYKINKKFNTTISVGSQTNPLELTDFEKYFDNYYSSQNSKARIDHPDYSFKYTSLNVNYIYSYHLFSTHLGPILGYSIAKYPNFKLYNEHAPSPSAFSEHRGPKPDISSLLIGFKLSQRYSITKSLFAAIDFSLQFSNHSYTFALQGVGLDAITPYDDTLSAKVINVGIKAGYFF